jgi:hypothetical protein
MRIARAIAEAVRLAFARDTLGREAPPSPDTAAPPAPGVLHVLFVSREPLGHEPEAPPQDGRPVLRWIFGIEALPRDPEPPPGPPRRSRLAALLAPEKLDDSP